MKKTPGVRKITEHDGKTVSGIRQEGDGVIIVSFEDGSALRILAIPGVYKTPRLVSVAVQKETAVMRRKLAKKEAWQDCSVEEKLERLKRSVWRVSRDADFGEDSVLRMKRLAELEIELGS